MSAIATKNSNAAFNRIFVAGVGVIVVAGVGAVVGHDVLDGLHVDRDCRPNTSCAQPQWRSCPKTTPMTLNPLRRRRVV
jgi:hypothetical protein